VTVLKKEIVDVTVTVCGRKPPVSLDLTFTRASNPAHSVSAHLRLSLNTSLPSQIAVNPAVTLPFPSPMSSTSLIFPPYLASGPQTHCSTMSMGLSGSLVHPFFSLHIRRLRHIYPNTMRLDSHIVPLVSATSRYGSPPGISNLHLSLLLSHTVRLTL
jgi:hypothetical protein